MSTPQPPAYPNPATPQYQPPAWTPTPPTPAAGAGSSYTSYAPVAAPVIAPPAPPAPPVGPPTPVAQGSSDPQVPASASALGRPELERLLAGLVLNEGSDMHLTSGEVPRYRVAGALRPVAGEDVSSQEYVERTLREALSPNAWEKFLDENDLDTAYQMDTNFGAALTSRFRINVFRSMGRTGIVARVIPTRILTLDQLGLRPAIKELAGKPRGLILVCGPTGSGKSTTLAGLVDLINTTRTERVFTFEDPIEFTHTSKKCLISHREIGVDTPSFAEGLRRVRREDPDIILVGEMRDYETIDAAIEAADTGHLVLSTLHTNSAAETISRIVNSFPAARQEQIKMTLSSVLLAVVCQTLLPSARPERARVCATEIMMVTPGIRNNIRENDIPAIANSLTDTSNGSISLDAHLAELVRQGDVQQKEAYKKATSRDALQRLLGTRESQGIARRI